MEKTNLQSIDTVCKIMSGDVRKRYYDKISIINVDPYSLSAEGFGTDAKDRNKWPDVTNFYIIDFLFLRSLHTSEISSVTTNPWKHTNTSKMDGFKKCFTQK